MSILAVRQLNQTASHSGYTPEGWDEVFSAKRSCCRMKTLARSTGSWEAIRISFKTKLIVGLFSSMCPYSSLRFSSSLSSSSLPHRLLLPYLSSYSFSLRLHTPVSFPLPKWKTRSRRRGRRAEGAVACQERRNVGFEDLQSFLRCPFSRDSNSRVNLGRGFGGCRSFSQNSSSLSSTVFEIDEDPDFSRAPTTAYVHLPFCRRRCYYCDFPILPVGERNERTKGHIDSTMSNYVDLVCKEIAITADRSRGGVSPLNTVFFGGGTPSLLPVPLLTKIMDELRSRFQVARDAEISIEMDPGTFDRDKLAGFLSSGITRVSLGVQSFQEDLLRACGRAHGLQDVYDAVEAIHSNGLKNWSLDLIASLPNQTLEQWQHSLSEAVSLQPAHVSVYDLQIEEGTLFHRWFKPGQDPLPSDEKSAELYCTASRTLRNAGFEHYEVSNYARPGFHCRHNLVYWENLPYYAFGLGSTSNVEGRRFSRPRKLKEYTAYVQNLEASGSDSSDLPRISAEDKVLDTIMLSLRLSRGLNLTEFEARFGFSFTSTVCCGLVPFVETGLVEAMDAQRQTIPSSFYVQDWKHAKVGVGPVAGEEWTHIDGRVGNAFVGEATGVPSIQTSRNSLAGSSDRRAAFVRLTDPEGFLLSNEVISSIFAALPSGGGC